MFKKNKKNILGKIKYPVGIQLINCNECKKYSEEEYTALVTAYLQSDNIKNKYCKLIESIIYDFEVAYLVAARPDTGDYIRVDESNKYLEELKKKFAEINNYEIKQVKNVK